MCVGLLACSCQSALPADGARGAEGPKGPQGERGPQGLQGEQGPAGPQGGKGDVGPAGKDGETGARGSYGLTGVDGPQGPQGEKGDTGATGGIGPQGPAGSVGPSGPGGSPQILEVANVNTPIRCDIANPATIVSQVVAGPAKLWISFRGVADRGFVGYLMIDGAQADPFPLAIAGNGTNAPWQQTTSAAATLATGTHTISVVEGGLCGGPGVAVGKMTILVWPG